jgi:hemolysin activation/secretion protein
VSSEDLETLRLALTRLYVDRGYVNSGAVIPDQKVAEGVVEVRVVEGQLTDIQVTGNQRLGSDYVSDRLALGAGPPLNVKGVQEQLQILLQGPFIQRINAELEPGDRPGEARLRAEVEEAPPVRLSVGTDTDLSPALGEARAVVRGQAFSPLGRGDVLTGEVAVASGLQDYILDYAIPLNAHDLTLGVFGEWTSSKVVRGELQDLDIRAESSTLAFRLSQPVYRTSQEQLTLAAGLDLRQSTTWLLDERFAFSPGVESDGESHVTVLRFVADWVTRSRSQVLAARSTVSWGIDAFGATDNSGGLPDGQFVAWLGQFQWARRLGETDSQLVFRFDGQMTSHPLLPLEQFAVGGLTSVRGYRTNEIVRDRGYIASLELRVPVLRREDGNPMLQVVPFVDAGGAWYKGYSTPDPNRITSAGLGLRWDPAPAVHAEVYYGQNFQGKGIPDDPSGLQNTGWSFLLTADLLTW